MEKNAEPNLNDMSERIFDEAKSYQMVSILKGAVDRRTGRKTKIEGIEILKNRPTNNNTDAWFIDFTSELIIGVYAGFDSPESLGKRRRIICHRTNFRSLYQNNMRTNLYCHLQSQRYKLAGIDYDTGTIAKTCRILIVSMRHSLKVIVRY